ncbi:amino acid adenylation domain-containing protein, partial [Kitasatospora sp. NPDC094015]|uniref:amino acid adenylation domain-containing protein n=1 Tax=Kitasatospora sp. NPDC094015 TaxID=3155205 RepID=UPI003333D9B5
ADAQPVLALAVGSTVGVLEGSSVPVLVLDEPGTAASIAGREAGDLGLVVSPRHPAYVIYTSGSTGRPKGVVVEHHSLAALLQTHLRSLIGPHFGDRTGVPAALVAGTTFDTSLDALCMLVAGHQLHLVPDEIRLDAGALIAYLAEHRIDFLDLTPSYLSVLMGEGLLAEDGPAPALLMVGGEALGAELWSRLRGVERTVVHNYYGPTECTVDAVAWPLAASEVPVIGRPIDNTLAYVLDEGLGLVPPGVPGELFLAGAGLARGYLNRPDLTAERFLPDPFGAAGTRMYRTGDLVRWTAAGVLEYLGRADDQVKIRGFRIELGEIEAVLAAHPAVAQAAVLVREQDRLVGYLVPHAGVVLDVDGVRAHVAAALPGYMVPSALVVLAEFPLTVHGKLDRRALPAPEVGTDPQGRAPRTDRERVLCGLFAELLGVERVSIDDNFFTLGGHSLLVTRLVSRIRTELAVELPLRALFETGTVAGLAERLGDAGTARTGLRQVVRPEVLPLSFAQQRLWFLNRFEDAGSTYNIPIGLRLSGAVDVPALGAALRDVVGRHESLRTVFPELEGVPFQRVLPLSEIGELLTLVDGSAGLAEAAACSFDVTVDLPLRAWLFQESAQESVLLVVLHHIAADGWSMLPLARDLGTAYAARCAGTAPEWDELGVQYADYALWQRELLGEESDPGSLVSAQLAYWRSALAGAPELLELPTDRPRPVEATHRGEVVAFHWDAATSQALGALARECGATVFMVVQAAVAALLSRLGAGTDIPLGTPVAGRTDEALDELVGFFVNTLVLRTDVSGDPSFRELVGRVRDADLAAFAHQDVPFERLVEVVNPARSMSRHPLFQVMLNFTDDGAGTEDVALPGLKAEPLAGVGRVAKFDLSFSFVDEGATGLAGSVEFATDLFDRATVETVLARLARLLEAVLADPERAVGEAELLSAQERHELLVVRNDTALAVPPGTVPELFEAQVRRTPDAVAVVCDGVELTYAELDVRANRLARLLIDRGVRPEDFVALSLPRSTAMMVAVLAVLKSGAAYLPVDPNYPADRIAYMLADAAPTLAVTVAATAAVAGGVPLVVLDDPETEALIASRPGTAPAAPDRAAELLPDHAAYVIYTSGSTGRPKGVVVAHRNVAGLAAWAAAELGPERLSHVLAATSLNFDVSVFEMFGPLLSGGRIEIVRDVLALLEGEGTRWSGSLLSGVPSALAHLVGQGRLELDTRMVALAGEGLSAHTLEAVRAAAPGATVANVYGPTETTVYATAWYTDTAVGSAPPIGRPIANTRVHVLDQALRPVPAGVPGELFVAGAGLARGYLNRPDLTADRFLPDPFGPPGTRMYRTGDVVRWTPDGELDYLGRSDSQVKVRGFRIELGEIETVLTGYQGVAQAAVLVREDQPGDQRLVAYLVAGPGVEAGGLREHAAAALPEYMVPAAFVLLDALPLNPNGKLDRRALPAPDFAAAAAGREPRTATERVLCALFAEVLGLERVGIDDGFFALGGHSLLVTRLVSRIRTELGIEAPIRALFDAPTVAALAERLGGAGEARGGLRSVDRPESVPLSFAQQRLWFLNRFEDAGSTYNIPIGLRLSGAVDVAALGGALRDVVGRHESLRTVFPELEGVPFQRVLPVSEVGELLTLVDGSAGLAEAAACSFDVTVDLPLRAWLFRESEQESVLLVVVHHIAADGWSMAPFARDLAEAYAARTTDRAPGWAALPVQYADYTLWQRELLGEESDPGSLISAQLAYWRSTLAELPAELALPADRPRPAESGARAELVDFALDAATSQALGALARECGATVFMVVQAAVAALLSRLGAGTDIPLGTPVAGRTDEALDELVGFFVNTLVLRTDVSGDPTFRELVGRVRDADLAAFAHQDVPFERLVEVLNPDRSMSRHPLFQVMVSFDEAAAGGDDLALPGLAVRPLEPVGEEAKFDLSFSIVERAGLGLGGSVEFSADLFDRGSAELLVGRFQRLLGAVAVDPDGRVGGVELLAGGEREALLSGWQGVSVE